MSSMETTPLTIAVSGRTNSGKTTLIRTLLKSAVGEVADAPNVTKTREVFYFEGIQARFVDTPGFQNASMLSMFYAMSEVNSNFSMPSELDSKIKFDKEAVQALRNADVVLYVASLSSVPDESFVEELSVIRRQCKRIVAVINQYHRQRDASTELLVNSRVAQWQAFCEANQIHNAVVFDAHWDNPRKVTELYDAILTILDPSGRDRFTVGLNKFKERQVDIRDEACKFLAKMIRKCNEFEIKMQKRESENSKIVDEARKAIAKQVEEHFVGFVFCVSKLYKIAADHPTSTLDQLKVNIESKIDHLQRISLAGGVATITSGIFPIALGAAVGVATGGAGALVGMQLGATFGGGSWGLQRVDGRL